MALNIPKEPPVNNTQQNNANNMQVAQKLNTDRNTGMSIEKTVKGANQNGAGRKTDNNLVTNSGMYECQTCANRKYQDGSSDMGVSMKSPTKLAPEAAAAAVASHEGEHISRDRAKAQSEGRVVVSQSVSIFMDVCPECGRPYVSGGQARTVTKSDNVRQQENNFKTKGKNVDINL